jgi:quinohemoprotein ethanol dehydrogenase
MGPLQAALDTLPPPWGELVAWNPVEQRAAWRVRHPTVDSSGVLTTAGNLVFQGRADGMLIAYRATDGTKLWEFDAGTGIMAPPVTYLVDGVQQVSVMAGLGGPEGVPALPDDGPVKFGYGRIVTFALGKSTALEVRPFGHTQPPVPAIEMDATPQMIAAGEQLYGGMCRRCHGVDAVAGPLPDLRYSSAAVHQEFEAIVRGGALAPLGMPAFDDLLTSEEVRSIQAYVLARAAESQ